MVLVSYGVGVIGATQVAGVDGDADGDVSDVLNCLVGARDALFSSLTLLAGSSMHDKLDPRRLCNLLVIESKERFRRRLIGPDRVKDDFRLREIGKFGVLLAILS